MVDETPAASAPGHANLPGSGGVIETLNRELLTAYREALRESSEVGVINRKLIEHELRIGGHRLWRRLVTRVDGAERPADDMKRFVDALAAADTVGKGQALAVAASTRAIRKVAIAALAAGSLAAVVAGIQDRVDKFVTFAGVLLVVGRVLGQALPLDHISGLGEPALSLLARTVDSKEADLFRAVGLAPPKRRLVRHAGHLLLAVLAFLGLLLPLTILLLAGELV